MSETILLECATPESQGVPSLAIQQFIEKIESETQELHSFMLLRHGKVIAEGWWAPYEAQRRHSLYSVSKSFTSTAIGLAVDEGLLTVDDLVLSYFPDATPPDTNAYWSQLRIKHLLSMATGHVEDVLAVLFREMSPDWVKTFFAVPLVNPPGTQFLYNSGATYMLAVILQQVTGQKLIDYLQPRLFAPLGIQDARWEESPQHINTGGWGLSVPTDAIARLGQLYLQKGVWRGQRILSEAWVNEATSAHIDNGTEAHNDWHQGYGYQFWRCRHGAYRGDGAFGQYCVVMPEQDAVLAMTGAVADMQIPLNWVWEILLPAMQPNALPENPLAQQALTSQISQLAFPLLPIASLPHPLPSVDAPYVDATHTLGIESLRFDFTDTLYNITFVTATGEDVLACGAGFWQASTVSIWKFGQSPDPKHVVACATWLNAHTLQVVVRLYETPFTNTLTVSWAHPQVTVESKMNFEFGFSGTWHWAGVCQDTQ